MQRVTGIGGIFFKAKDPEGLYAWYEKHLGLRRDAQAQVVVFVIPTKNAPRRGARLETRS